MTKSHVRPPSAPRAAGESGFSLIQVLVAAAILAIAALALSATQIQSLSLTTANRETAVARQVARQILEEIREVAVEEAYARYNANPSDDPGGCGTAPGSTCQVSTEVGTMTGTVEFPGGNCLREDADDGDLGMPMDLNGDGTIDDQNHASDYRLLPLRIRVSWSGTRGARTLELHAVLLNQ